MPDRIHIESFFPLLLPGIVEDTCELSKLCLMVEGKSITLQNAYRECRESVDDNHIIHGVE